MTDADEKPDVAADEPSARAEPGKVRYVDLTLGAWRPREAAAQLAAGLGLTLPVAEPASSFVNPDTADIDIQSVGDPVLLRCHDDAKRIAAALPTNGAVTLLAPRYGLHLRYENEWFFLFLRRRGIAIALIGEEPKAVVTGRYVFERRRGVKEPAAGETAELSPLQRRVLRLFPGLLPRAVATELEITVGGAFLVPVGPNHFLIPPALRDTDPQAAARDFDAMADLEASDDGLKALVESFCTAHFADGAAIVALSRQWSEDGAADIADDLAERARQVARTPEEMAAADIRLQETRLARGWFPEMLAMPPPSRQASDAVRKRLDRLKLEAAVVSGDTRNAGQEIAAIEEALAAGQPVAVTDMRLVDDVVAAWATTGESDRAVGLAESVRAALDRDAVADPRLVFRNAISRARLYRRRKQIELERAALEVAFATSAGVRSLGEVVEMNALVAGVAGGRTSPSAQLAWLRAALAWLAFEPPEALPVGAIRAAGGIGQVRSRLDLDISEGMADRLAEAWPDLVPTKESSYPAVRAMADGAKPAKLFGAPGASVLWLASTGRPPVYVRPRVRLVRLVTAALASLCPAFPGVDGGTLFIDHNAGRDVPATREEALSVALRARVEEAIFGTETIRLDTVSRSRLLSGLLVRLSPAVSSVEGNDDHLTLGFRRHRSDLTLTGGDADAVAPLRDGAQMLLGSLAVLLGETTVNAERLYRRLEALGIVRVDFVRREEPAKASPAADALPAKRTDS
jgi:hypothetical protein